MCTCAKRPCHVGRVLSGAIAVRAAVHRGRNSASSHKQTNGRPAGHGFATSLTFWPQCTLVGAAEFGLFVGSTMSVGEVEDFATEYNEQLRAMTRPAKEEINALTMVAADYVESPAFAHAVVNVLERTIHEVMRAARG